MLCGLDPCPKRQQSKQQRRKHGARDYAIIEPAWRNPAAEEQGLSQLVESWIKKEEPNPKLKGTAYAPSVSQLVNLDKLLSPLVVVPDLDNTNRRAYLWVLSRSLWAGVYEDYLLDDNP